MTEACEKRIVVSQRERMSQFVKLASNLSHSEEKNWKDQYRGFDKAQKTRNDERYNHYFIQAAGPMQKDQHPLYSQWKQSKVRQFQAGPLEVKWADWESTSEYDTDIDDGIEQLRKEGVRRHMLQNLNEMGAVLVQPKPIASSLHLLTHTLALIMSRGTPTYSEEAVHEAE